MELNEYIYKQIQSGQVNEKTGKQYLEEILPDEIAIVGLSCEYSNIKDKDEFYKMLKNGKRSFREFPNERKNLIPKNHEYLVSNSKKINTTSEDLLNKLIKEKGGYLDDIDKFDPRFFGISENEAKYIDPTHRLVLKHAALSFEDAGISLDKIQNTKTAVYIGKDKSITTNYKTEIEQDSPLINSGTWEGILASRLNYIFNLGGGSFVVDTACSSSLVATHLAIKTLRDKEIDAAVVGGIALGMFPRQGSTLRQYSDVETDLPFMKVFDKESKGTIFAEGIGVVILKRLRDAIKDNDNIYSVIRGSMINSDGHSNGLTAPNPHAQEELLVDLYKHNNISPETVEYIDAHGTGTKLGDPIEVKGITNAYRKYTNKIGFSALSSVKQNIGHTVGAAGVAGLIKMSLALKHKEIFKVESFEAPNEFINMIESPFYIPNKTTHWKKGRYPRRGGVSSFGFSGTNAHIVLEEYVKKENSGAEVVDTQKELPFLFSSPSREQLIAYLKRFLKYKKIIEQNDFSNVAYTLARRRERYEFRFAIEASDWNTLFGKIKKSIDEFKERNANNDIVNIKELKLTKENKKIIFYQEMLKKNSDTKKAVDLFLEGIEIPANILVDSKHETISLPSFVFNEKSYWGTVKKYDKYHNKNIEILPYLFLKNRVFTSINTDLLEVTLSSKNWFVNEHRIQGKMTLSGTTYMQIAFELSKLYFNSPTFRVEKLQFLNMVQLDTDEITFNLVVHKESKNSIKVEVVSGKNDEKIYSKFTVEKGDALDSNKINTEKVFERYIEKKKYEVNSSNFKGRWDYGQAYGFKQIDDDTLLSSLELNSKYKEDLDTFTIHPAILDVLLSSILLQEIDRQSKIFLPFSYGKTTFFGNRMTMKNYAKAKVNYNRDSSQKLLSSDVTIYNSKGEKVLFVENYTMKAVDTIELDPKFTELSWCESGLKIPNNINSSSTLFDKNNEKKTLLITEFLNFDEVNGYDYLNFEDLENKKLSEKYDYIFYSPDSNNSGDNWKNLLEKYYNHAKIISNSLNKNGKLLIFSERAFSKEKNNSYLNAMSYAVANSFRIITDEKSNTSCTIVSGVKNDKRLLNYLMKLEEINNKKVLIDNDVIKFQKLTPKKRLNNQNVKLKDEDVVVITGGYGGVGLKYIDKLTDIKKDCNIAVLSRHDLQTEELSKLQSKNKNIKHYKVDVTKKNEVASIMRKLNEKFNIKGIIHLAGIPDGGILFNKTKEDFLKVAEPKVLGAINLLDSINNQNLDFFLMSSSMTTIVGSPGQFSYTFANSFLEGLSFNNDKCKTVLWPGWKNVGMAAKLIKDSKEIEDQLLMKNLDDMEGATYAGLSLNKNFNCMIFGEFNYHKMSELLKHDFNLDDFNLDGENYEHKKESNKDLEFKEYEKITVVGADVQNEVEKYITVVFASVIGTDEIDVNKSFTDMGGDSLKAFAIYTPIAQKFDVDLEVADVFVYSTINKLSEYILQEIGE
jgi:3-oxoacyl-(acyl-carrier-protein) synthase/short-subunit dehydrogenase/acyl carrier protein